MVSANNAAAKVLCYIRRSRCFNPDHIAAFCNRSSMYTVGTFSNTDTRKTDSYAPRIPTYRIPTH